MTIIFGGRWDAPICDEAEEVAVPVGTLCLRCSEAIEASDQGVVMPLTLHPTQVSAYEAYKIGDAMAGVEVSWISTAQHRECNLIGLVGHMVGVCSCTGYDTVSREAAREAQRRVEAGALRQGKTFTCPRCQRTTNNPNDVREGYCGACHDWTR